MDRSLLHAPEEELLRGGLEHCEPFPGVELSWIRFHAPRIETEHAPLAHVLEVNHCRRGRIGWDMKGGTSVYLGPGDLDVHTMDCCAVSTINLPLGYYEGITVALDLEQLERIPLPLVEEAGIDTRSLLNRLCPGGEPLALPAGAASARIFDPLYTVPESFRLPYCRLKVLELLLFLEELEPGLIFPARVVGTRNASIFFQIFPGFNAISPRPDGWQAAAGDQILFQISGVSRDQANLKAWGRPLRPVA